MLDENFDMTPDVNQMTMWALCNQVLMQEPGLEDLKCPMLNFVKYMMKNKQKFPVPADQFHNKFALWAASHRDDLKEDNRVGLINNKLVYYSVSATKNGFRNLSPED